MRVLIFLLITASIAVSNQEQPLLEIHMPPARSAEMDHALRMGRLLSMQPTPKSEFAFTG